MAYAADFICGSGRIKSRFFFPVYERNRGVSGVCSGVVAVVIDKTVTSGPHAPTDTPSTFDNLLLLTRRTLPGRQINTRIIKNKKWHRARSDGCEISLRNRYQQSLIQRGGSPLRTLTTHSDKKSSSTFQIRYRSQQDPLIHDQDASDFVFTAVNAPNQKVKNARQLAASLGPESVAIRANEGEAAMYGVYYDDTEYDYMQHMREIGDSTEGVFIEAPQEQKGKGKGKGV